MEHTRRRHKIPEERWLRQKPLIRQLWLVSNLTFEQVAARLAEDEAFKDLSKRQFEHHMDIWKYKKRDYIRGAHNPTKTQSQPAPPPQQTPTATISQVPEPTCKTRPGDFFKKFAICKKFFTRLRQPHAPQEDDRSEDEAPAPSGEELNQDSLPEQLVYFPVGSTLRFAATNFDRVEVLVLTEGRVRKLDIESQDFYEALQKDDRYSQAHFAQCQCHYAEAEAIYWDLIQRWRNGEYPPDRRIFEFYRRAAVCMINRGALRQAREITTQLYDVTCNLLPPEDCQRMWVSKTMAAVNERSGPSTLASAGQQYHELWEISSQLYGEMHGFTVTAMAGVASVLRLQDRLPESQEMFARVVELRAQANDDDVDDFSHCQELRQFADVLSDRDSFEYSIPMYQDAARKALAHLGPLHQITLRIQSNLAADLRIVKDYQQSSELLLSTYIKQRLLLGEDHPDAFWTLYQYAKCEMFMKQYAIALMWMKEVYTYRCKHFGVLHIRTINCCIWLGWLSENAEQWPAALRYYRRAWNRLTQLAQNESSESYSALYRPRWINKAIARTRLLTGESAYDDEEVRRDAFEKLEIVDPNNDETPVQCVIEVESDCPETCAVVF